MDLRKFAINRIKRIKKMHLSVLDLCNYELIQIPDELFELTNLRDLHLSDNLLEQLPEKISKLAKLGQLDLSFNKIVEFPKQILELENLRFLNLAGNHLVELPKEIARLKNLEVLRLSGNQLRELPGEISKLVKLHYLDLEGNPLEVPLPEIAHARRNIKLIRNYFKDLEEQGKSYIYEAKLLLVGEPGAGKTSLSEKLRNPKYELNPTEPMTKGIDVKRWNFPYNDDIEFRANIWDFGGQEIMHATHRYFLTKRSLYLVVADNRKEDTDFYYWLKLVELLSAKSPTIIVLNEWFNYRKYMPSNILETFTSVQKAFNINLKNNNGLLDLSKAVQQYIKSLPHVGKESLPKKWIEIRRVLENETRDYISCKRYLVICKKHGIYEREKALYISELLHDLGVILHFQKDRFLRDILILNTRWATEAAYMILFDVTVSDNGGEFDNTDLERIWYSYRYRDKHGELLQLMINFELCYKIGNSQKYIIPELLPEKPPISSPFKDIENFDIMHFGYRYKFMPKGIISRLIVRLNTYIYRKNQWKSGVVLHIEKTLVEIIEYIRQGILKIRISGESKHEALTIVRKEINELHDTFENLEADEMIPCNCDECTDSEEPHFYRYSLLEKYQRKRRNKIVCEKSVNDVDIQMLISDIIIPRREERKYQKFLRDRDKNYKKKKKNI